jgi:DNA-binding CsgD family transcriptional regulator
VPGPRSSRVGKVDRPTADCVGIVEALYALELREGQWLAHIAAATAEGLGIRNRGAYAVTYDASDIHDCRFPDFAATEAVDPELARALSTDFPEFYRRSPAMVDDVLRHVAFAPSRKLPTPRRLDEAHALLGRFGVHEILGLNGVNPDGRGAHIGLLVPRRATSPDPDLLARLSSHLAAAWRLRRRLAGAPAIESADAVIEVTGTIVHAARGAKLREAREALTAAARRLEHLRGPVRRRDPEQAARQWKALVEGQWSLVDQFESDGRRFLLAQSNEAPTAAVAFLSQRERQVVALAALGHANKMIAYELGIAISTVGVLLGRAARKFGATKRAALIAAYEAARGRHADAE